MMIFIPFTIMYVEKKDLCNYLKSIDKELTKNDFGSEILVIFYSLILFITENIFSD